MAGPLVEAFDRRLRLLEMGRVTSKSRLWKTRLQAKGKAILDPRACFYRYTAVRTFFRALDERRERLGETFAEVVGEVNAHA